MKLRALTLFASLSLAACGDSHPLAGSWSQETPDHKPGMSLSFETKEGGTRLQVHTAPDANDSHEHIHGTYTFDAATGAVSVDAELLGKGKPGKWTGKLADGHLELGAADTKLEFHQGKDPHGH
ncbi:MAG: hypothetical protein H6835_07095 [Planctomycetes bacterium]|nr:hypothetical protein [Planctomycetota bacterium]